jgi:ribosomal protein L21
MRVRTMFAVLKTGGKQYKVAKNDIIEISACPARPARRSSSTRF